MTLDETDAKIVALLQGSTRLTNEEIGRKVNLSPTAVAKRRKRLDQSGVISAQVAVLDLNAVGPFVSAHVLCSFQPGGAAIIDEFTDAVMARPEVTNCWVVTGDVDVILNVMTRTLDEYERVIRELQEAFPQIKTVKTYVILRQTKRSLAVPSTLIG